MPLVSDYLRQARETRGVSPLQIEIDTRIRAQVIEALEAGDFARLPPEPFLRGLVRTYAGYLGADQQEALRLLILDLTAPPPPKPRPTPRPAISPPISIRAPAPSPPGPDQTAPPTPRPVERLIPDPIVSPEYALQSTILAEIESLPPPEKLSAGTIFPRPAGPSILRDLRALIPLPLPAIIGIGVFGLIILFACGVFALTQFSAIVSSTARRTPTVTRVLPTVTLPIPGGGAPTSIPTFAATAPPFATFPGNPTLPRARTTRRPIDASMPLNVDIDAIESVKAVIGVDGVVVFSGAIDPGTSRSWSAKESIYFRVENAKGAEIFFNGKQQLAAVFAEKNLMERQWTANSKGTPVSSRPTPPKTQTPIPSPSATQTLSTESPTPIPTPTPTRTPF